MDFSAFPRHHCRLATNELVAIKIIRTPAVSKANALQRFQREASILLRLQHKRIVTTLDSKITLERSPCLVMELVDEVKLMNLPGDANPVDRWRLACGVMVRVLEGLQYAHDMEIGHRDIKPTNLLAVYSGRKLQVKLADFGLAKNYIDAVFGDLTGSDELCGTVAYMSPEQIKDCRHAKPTCDIYASGVCLYYMLSGQLPYDADGLHRQIGLILDGNLTPVTKHVSNLLPRLAGIIAKAISHDPSFRYATADNMRQDLLPFSKRKRLP